MIDQHRTRTILVPRRALSDPRVRLLYQTIEELQRFEIARRLAAI